MSIFIRASIEDASAKSSSKHARARYSKANKSYFVHMVGVRNE